MKIPALLALEDGTVFKGISIGYQGSFQGEVVFNTAMSGYQEILTDPSYARLIVTLTYPHIGNVGVNPEDEESPNLLVSGLVIRSLSLVQSNWRSKSSLEDYLTKNKVAGIAEIDTRALTNLLREKGAMNACIWAGKDADAEEAVKRANSFPGLKGMDLAKEVTTDKAYEWMEGTWQYVKGISQIPRYNKSDLPFHVVVVDFGVKQNILRLLVDRGCHLAVVPAKTAAKGIMQYAPDGVLLSNGPGDPEPCAYAIESIKTLLDHEIPIFGICLGHQLLSLASDAKTEKMKFGHHGANHPVQCLESNKVMITSQNHGFTVSESTLQAHTAVTHRSLFDGSIQGIKRLDKPAFSFQGHPEASPGPHDIEILFDNFMQLISDTKRPQNKVATSELEAEVD